MHEKEPQEPPEHTSEHVKSQNFLGACPQTPRINPFCGAHFLHLPWAPPILSAALLACLVRAGASYFRLVRPLRVRKCEQGRGVWGHAPPGKFVKIRHSKIASEATFGPKKLLESPHLQFLCGGPVSSLPTLRYYIRHSVSTQSIFT